VVERKDYERIFQFKKGLQLSSRESTWVEFKESFNWNSKDKYAKTMVSFANNRGGFIVFGVRNKPRELVGLTNDNFETFDEARITEYLNSVLSPEIQFEKFIMEFKDKKVGIIYTNVCENKPVICIKNDNDLKEAEIYYRYNGRSEKIKFPEFREIIEEIRIKEERKWQDLLKSISLADPSQLNVIFDSSKDVGNKKNIVRITDDPSAPTVRVKEDNLLKGYWDYKRLKDELRNRYVDLKFNNNFHNIKRNLEGNDHLCIIRLLDPDNPKSSKKKYYHPNIVKEFDKYYTLK
jgi:predicted HTH transcriptional regulator